MEWCVLYDVLGCRVGALALVQSCVYSVPFFQLGRMQGVPFRVASHGDGVPCLWAGPGASVIYIIRVASIWV